MSANPFAGTPGEAGWAMGFVAGYIGPNFSVPPPAVLAPELIQPFIQGQLAGQRAAIDGMEVSPDCVDTKLPSAFGATAVAIGGKLIEAGMVGADVLKGIGAEAGQGAAAFAGAALGAVVLVIGLGSAASDFRPAEEVLLELTERFVSQLNQFGTASLELFIGAAFEGTAQKCELRLTRVFRSVEQASSAAKAMRRRSWVVARWRTDASGSLEIVDASS